MQIVELREVTAQQLTDLTGLMKELSERVTMTEEALLHVLKDDNCRLFALMDEGSVMGCATLCVFHSPTGRNASVEDVVVSSRCRGRHWGRALMVRVLEEAQMFAPIEVQLTSKPKRVAANALYQSLGFQRKETNCYRLALS